MKLDIYTLKRFFEGKYSQLDYEAIRECIENDLADRNILELMEVHFNEFSQLPVEEADLEYLRQKLHRQIEKAESKKTDISRDLTKPGSQSRFAEPLTHHGDDRRILHPFLRWFQRVAAILIVPLLLAFLAYVNFAPKSQIEPKTLTEIQCPLGTRTKFILPDGTTGFLNSGSTLTYTLLFRDLREVRLTGEAFFHVTKQDNLPFVVHIKNLKLKVLGTTFNVISYPDETSEEVILQTGKLEVLTKEGLSLCLLNPDEKIAIGPTQSRGTKTQVVASQYTSWKEGKLTFRNEALDQVAKRLSRWYNAEIEIADPQLMNYTFYATFQDEQLDEVLKLLALTSPISYREVKREKNPDGTFAKRKIILKLNLEKIKQFK